MTNQLFEAALGIKAPWYVQGVGFDRAKRKFTIVVDFVAGSRFACPGVAGEHPVHDTQTSHEYLTLVADMRARWVVFVTPGRDAKTIEGFAAYLSQHQGAPEQVTSVSIDMSPAFIKGVGEHLPNARLPFDKFHVVAHASSVLDTVRRQQQKADPELKGNALDVAQGRQQTVSGAVDRPRGAGQAVRHQAHRPRLVVSRAAARDSRAQANACRLRDVAAAVHQRHALESRADEGCRASDSPALRRHRCLDAQARQTNGFIQAINGLFQAARRKARGYTRFTTMRTVLFLIAGKLDFSSFNPHAS